MFPECPLNPSADAEPLPMFYTILDPIPSGLDKETATAQRMSVYSSMLLDERAVHTTETEGFMHFCTV
jgi:hypothetical protein